MREQHGGLKFGEAIVGTAAGTRALFAATGRVKIVAEVGKRFVVGEDRAAFAGREVFTRLKTKAAAEADGADGLAAPFGQRSLTGIFEERDLARRRESGEGVEIGG